MYQNPILTVLNVQLDESNPILTEISDAMTAHALVHPQHVF